MVFSNVKFGRKTVKTNNTGKQLQLIRKFKKGKHKISFDYVAKPEQTMYFIGSGANTQIWTQGQGKYTSHWFPSFDDVNEKVAFDISAAYGRDFKVISNGSLKSAVLNGTTLKWNYEMENPMSSYLLMLAIGKYDKSEQKAASGVPLEFYIEPEDRAKSEPTYRYSKQIFDFLESEIGVAYPWGIYKQVPVRDFLYAGMENTTATVFATDFVVDSIGFNDRNYINVNAHELAHQWFGDFVTAKSGTHHWLQEGFATYYALLAERAVFGDDYFHQKLYEMAGNLQQAAKTDMIPVLNEKASSLTFYQKGAWALHVLREEIGAENFKAAVRNYLQRHRFSSVETADFFSEVNAVSDFDTASFQRKWLESGGFETEEALTLLKRNAFVREYLTVLDRSSEPYASKRTAFEAAMKSNVAEAIKEEMILQTQEVPFEEKEALLRSAMQTGNVKIRQAVAKTLTKFPPSFVTEFATLLDDRSYVTQEIALNVLWSQFPDMRSQILDRTAGRIGMNDKNLRILWLTLALATKDYKITEKPTLYKELLDYASAKNETPVRMNAIENLLFIDKNDSNVLGQLVSLTTHHKWQVVQYSRGKIRLLLKNKNHRTYFESLLPSLSDPEKAQLQRLLSEK
jgi:aminopeptidase N